MFTLIEKNNLDSFLIRYPELEENIDLFLLHENENHYFLPRFFYKNYPSNHIRVLDPPYSPAEIKVNFTKDLRETQKKIVQKILIEYDKTNSINGVIKAPPGTGKTCMGIYLSTKIKLKTLIIVDKDPLFKQWIKEILHFTDLPEDNIGQIKQKKFPKNNEPIIISTVQTLLSKFKQNSKDFYYKLKELGIGLVIFDEVHNTSSSEKYAKVSTILSTNNILGLSATPYKTGGQKILMENTIGSTIVDNFDYNLIPELHFISYESKLSNYKIMLAKTKDFIMRKAIYNKILVKSETYLDLFPKFIKEDLKNKHKTIIICWTENQVKAISNKLNEHGITCTEYYGKARTFSTDDQTLVATYQFAGTGFDFKNLSSLIYACPLSGRISLIQTAGRILRSCQDKTSPLIRFLVDETFPKESTEEMNRAENIFKKEFENIVIKKV